MTTWTISSEGGQELTTGIQSEREARAAAQRHANETGAAVCLDGGSREEWIDPDYGTLRDYQSGVDIRPATRQEQDKSRTQALRDGGAGVIEVDGRSCYVED